MTGNLVIALGNTVWHVSTGQWEEGFHQGQRIPCVVCLPLELSSMLVDGDKHEVGGTLQAFVRHFIFRKYFIVAIFNWDFLLLSSFCHCVCACVHAHTICTPVFWVCGGQKWQGTEVTEVELSELEPLIQEDLASRRVARWPICLSSTGIPGICCCT